jgi:hypothetical protein
MTGAAYLLLWMEGVRVPPPAVLPAETVGVCDRLGLAAVCARAGALAACSRGVVAAACARPVLAGVPARAMIVRCR